MRYTDATNHCSQSCNLASLINDPSRANTFQNSVNTGIFFSQGQYLLNGSGTFLGNNVSSTKFSA